MTAENFCYWLQGYLELADADKNKMGDSLSIQQTQCIKEHLKMVFTPAIQTTTQGSEAFKDFAKAVQTGQGTTFLDGIKYC